MNNIPLNEIDFNIDNYIRDLLDKKGLTETKEDDLEEIKHLVYLKVDDSLIKNIPKEKLDDLVKLISEGDKEKLREFCRENIPGLKQIVQETLDSFSNEYLSK